MRRLFIVLNVILLTMCLILKNSDAQMVGHELLPDGAKERFGKGWIRDVEFSPDGNKFAVATTIGVWIYDSSTGKDENLLEDSMISGAETLSYAPFDSMLAVAHEDFTIRLWNPTIRNQDRPIPTLRGHSKRINAIMFSPDGRMLASASDDQTIRLWNPYGESDREKLLAILPYNAPVISVDISQDSQLIGGGSADGVLKVWDAGRGESLYESLSAHNDAVMTIGFSADRTELASASSDGSFKIWDLVGNDINLKTVEQWDSRFYVLKFSPDGNTVATGTSDKQIMVWNRLTAAEVNPLKGHQDIVTALDYSPDGRSLVSGSPDGRILFWDTVSTRKRYEIVGHTGGIKALVYTEDRRIRACGAGLDAKLRIWDAGTSRTLSLLHDHIGLAQTAIFSKDGKKVASGGHQDGTIFLSDVIRILEGNNGFDQDSLMTILSGNDHGITALAIAPEGTTLASGGVDGRIHLIDLNSNRSLGILRGPQSTITSLTFVEDSTRLFSGEENGTIRQWNGLSGSEIGDGFAVSFGAVTALTYSPINKLLVVGDRNGKIQFLNPETGKRKAKEFQTPHRSKITSLVFSEDGTSLVSGSENGTILHWGMNEVQRSSEKQVDVSLNQNAHQQVERKVDNNKKTLTAQEIAQKARTSTVLLWTLNANGDVVGSGSGFFVSSGKIATNYHVIDGATTIFARVIEKEKTYVVESIAASDKSHDLVILTVPDVTTPTLELADSDKVEIGENVYAIGNPQGWEGTFSEGIISSIREYSTNKWIQITAPVSPGSSGGAVLNNKGEVIGIATVAYFRIEPKLKVNRSQNINFAVPSNYLNTLLRKANNP